MMTPGKIRCWAGRFLCLGTGWASRVAATTTAATQVLNRQYIFTVEFQPFIAAFAGECDLVRFTSKYCRHGFFTFDGFFRYYFVFTTSLNSRKPS